MLRFDLQKHPDCSRAVGVQCGVETCAPEVSRIRDPSFGFPAPAWCAGFGYIERHARRKEKGVAHEAKLMPRTDLTSRHRLTLSSASTTLQTGQLGGKTQVALGGRQEIVYPATRTRSVSEEMRPKFLAHAAGECGSRNGRLVTDPCMTGGCVLNRAIYTWHPCGHAGRAGGASLRGICSGITNRR